MHKGRVVFGAMDEVVFGNPAAAAIVEQMERLAAARAFLMVSGTLNRQTDEIERIRKALGPRCAGVFDAMPPHTPREAVIAASEQARAAGADLIVTVGGGSITDGAKAVQLCLANDIRTVEAIDRVRTVRGVVPTITAPTVRQISVPTTIAGGEFSAIAGVTNARTRVKEMLRHELVMPRAVILDPAITVHTPEWLFLSTGIRAVDHCVEGICSREAHPYADAQALKGLAMLAEGLPRVKTDARDLDARMDCQIGTWLSVGPLTSGVPILQAMETVAGTVGNTIMADAVLEARARIREGDRIGDPLEESRLFPPMVVHMIGVGEESGSLDFMLQKIADFYESEVEAQLASLTAALEPIMIVFLAVIVGSIVIALFLPLIVLMDKVGETGGGKSKGGE